MKSITAYCTPSNAGLASEPRAAGRRIGRLLDALGTEVNNFVCEGDIAEDVRQFRISLIEKLRAEGWRIKLNASNKWQVLPPRKS